MRRDDTLRAGEQQLRARGAALDRVAGVTALEELDWTAIVRQIDQLTAERHRLTGASGELARLQGLLTEASGAVDRAQRQRDQLLSRSGATEDEKRRALAEADVRRQRAATARNVDEAVLGALDRAAPLPAPTGVAGWDDWEKSALAALTDEHDRATGRCIRLPTTISSNSSTAPAWRALIMWDGVPGRCLPGCRCRASGRDPRSGDTPFVHIPCIPGV